MNYKNSAGVLPPELLREIQKYIQGETLYIPKTTRKAWGEGTGAKSFYTQRDAGIRNQFS